MCWGALKPTEHSQWVANYFAATVACPFLDDEACSIYPDRPTICREYLVTSPAENCRSPTPDTIRRVPIAGSLSAALIMVDRDPDGEHHGPLLLVESLAWVAANPPPPPSKTGPERVQQVFAALAAKS